MCIVIAHLCRSIGERTKSCNQSMNGNLCDRHFFIFQCLIVSSLDCLCRFSEHLFSQVLLNQQCVQNLTIFSLRPETVKITGSKAGLSAGTEVRLSCLAAGSRPAAVLTWFNGTSLYPHQPAGQVHTTTRAPIGAGTFRFPLF